MVSLVWSSPCLTLHFGINTLYSHGMVQPMRWGRSGSTSYCWSMGEWSWGLFTLRLGTRSPVHVEIVMESLKPSETRGEMVVRNSTWSNVALTFDHEHQFNMHRICMTWPLCQCLNCFGCVVQKKKHARRFLSRAVWAKSYNVRMSQAFWHVWRIVYRKAMKGIWACGCPCVCGKGQGTGCGGMLQDSIFLKRQRSAKYREGSEVPRMVTAHPSSS